MKKNVTLSLLGFILGGCLLLSIGLAVGAFYLFRAQKNYTPPLITVAPTATLRTIVSSPQPTPQPGQATPVPTSSSSAQIPAEIAVQMDRIQEQVSAIRGLSIRTELMRALMNDSELKDKVVNEFFADYTPEDAKNDVKILSTLGLLETGFDLRQFYLDLYSEQIAGYYDSTTKDMYVIANDTFGGLERMTYAHEFTHVLQDQHYDLENGLKLNEDYCKNETEYCAAVSALVEGDATLTEQSWFLQHSTQQDKNDVVAFQQNYSSPVYDSAPAYMQLDFLFPYQQGFDFANTLYGRDGWNSIDQAFLNPPVSTEQILHPEKYPKEIPVKVELPDFLPTLGPGWQELDRNVMGEWYSYLILAAGRNQQFVLSSKDASKATTGWGGDTYVYLSNDSANKYAFAWLINWDTQQDKREFFSASSNYGAARWGEPLSRNLNQIRWNSNEDGVISITQHGNQVLWVMSSDAVTAETVESQIVFTGN
jgi:hypothetical protein